MINKEYKLTKFTDPYPGLKIENFFNKEFYSQLERSFPSENDFFAAINKVNRMTYDTSFGDKLYNNLLLKSKAYEELHNYVYSSDFMSFVINFFKKDIINEIKKKNLIKNVLDFELNPEPYEKEIIDQKKLFKFKTSKNFLYPRIDLGMGKEGYGKDNGGKGIHVDNPQRLICLLFFLGGNKKMIGGEHRVWKENNTSINTPTMELVRSVKPFPNLLIGNLNSNKAYHDVNPITYIKGSRNCFFIAISSSCKIWKDLENNNFNKLYNRNRTQIYRKKNLISKIEKVLF